MPAARPILSFADVLALGDTMPARFPSWPVAPGGGRWDRKLPRDADPADVERLYVHLLRTHRPAEWSPKPFLSRPFVPAYLRALDRVLRDPTSGPFQRDALAGEHLFLFDVDDRKRARDPDALDILAADPEVFLRRFEAWTWMVRTFQRLPIKRYPTLDRYAEDPDLVRRAQGVMADALNHRSLEGFTEVRHAFALVLADGSAPSVALVLRAAKRGAGVRPEAYQRNCDTVAQVRWMLSPYADDPAHAEARALLDGCGC